MMPAAPAARMGPGKECGTCRLCRMDLLRLPASGRVGRCCGPFPRCGRRLPSRPCGLPSSSPQSGGRTRSSTALTGAARPFRPQSSSPSLRSSARGSWRDTACDSTTRTEESQRSGTGADGPPPLLPALASTVSSGVRTVAAAATSGAAISQATMRPGECSGIRCHRLRAAAGELLGGGEERAAEPAPELVPAADLLARLGPQPLGIGRRIARVADPASELRLRHLGVELDAPARCRRAGTPAATPRCARARPLPPAGRARSGARSARRSARAAPRRRDPRRAASVSSTSPQPISGTGSRPTQAPVARASSSRAEADAERRHLLLDQPAQPVGLVAQPREQVVLVGMHEAAEDEHGVVCVERLRRRLARSKLHSSRRCPASATSGPNSSGPASSPCTIERMFIAFRRSRRSGSRRGAAAAAARSSRPARRGRAGCRDPPTRRCC